MRVESNAIFDVEYDPKTRILAQVFKNGRIYQYGDVSQEEIHAYQLASSKGTFFNKEIRPRHAYREINILRPAELGPWLPAGTRRARR